jgi:hypothetical protein
VTTATAHDLLATARDLIRIEDAWAAGLWPRAAAFLARQGIEAAMASLWAVRAPGLERESARCQLLCLATFLGDADLSGRISAAWWGLSRSCHHRVYELPPTAGELNVWLESGWELADRVAAAVT